MSWNLLWQLSWVISLHLSPAWINPPVTQLSSLANGLFPSVIASFLRSILIIGTKRKLSSWRLNHHGPAGSRTCGAVSGRRSEAPGFTARHKTSSPSRLSDGLHGKVNICTSWRLAAHIWSSENKSLSWLHKYSYLQSQQTTAAGLRSSSPRQGFISEMLN